MKKIIIIISIVIAVVIGAWFWLNTGDDIDPKEPGTFTDLDPINTGTGIDIIKTPDTLGVIAVPVDDGVVNITDVRTLSDTDKLGEGFYALTGSEYRPDSIYSMTYAEFDNSFAISLDAEPISESRIAAEQAFLSMLNVTEEEACRLSVFLGVPYELNPFFSGKHLGFSFCPGSVPLE